MVAVSQHVPEYTCYPHQPDYRNQNENHLKYHIRQRKVHERKGQGFNQRSLPLLKEKVVIEHEEGRIWRWRKLLGTVDNK